MIIVLPSNREINLNYLSPLIDQGVRFIVVDDSPGSIRMKHPQFEIYNWEDRRKMLGKLDEGFPRKNGACRDFGFYVAWKESDPEEIIIALDDDCEIYAPDFKQQSEQLLSDLARPVATTEGLHLNILELYNNTEQPIFPRGFPYSSRIDHKGIKLLGTEKRNVTFNLGLWKGVFDVNAIDKIKGPAYAYPDATLHHPSVIIEKNKLVSVCSMNMHFRKELTPAVYQLPMHVEVMPNWVIDRYGDIWGGFILKTLMDIKGEAMSAGEPMINHIKEGNVERNTWQEHVCHMVNDEFIALLQTISKSISSSDYLTMMENFQEELSKHVEGSSVLLKPYLKHLANSMHSWNLALRG